MVIDLLFKDIISIKSRKFLSLDRLQISNEFTKNVMNFLKQNTEPINISNYNYPKLSEFKNDEFLLTILGTNDIHGSAYERQNEYNHINYTIGGYRLLSGIIKKFREEYKDHFLWFDGGDQFTGTFENIKTTGQLMVDFYNIMKVDGVAIGNHEWDNKEIQIRKWMRSELGRYINKKDRKNDDKLYMAANLNLKEGIDKSEELPNKIPYKIFEYKEGKIKIGVIGLTTIFTLVTSAGFNPQKFIVEDYKEIILKISAELRSKGVQAILIVSHVGMNCKSIDLNKEQINDYYKLDLRSKNTKQDIKCTGEMFELLNQLPEGTIDGVIGGHEHESIHHFINGTPVIQNPSKNLFANMLYFKFKTDTNGNYRLDSDHSLIEGPIPICSKIFTNNNRCNDYQPFESDVKISEYIFHENKIEYDPSIEKVFEKYVLVEEEIKKMKKNTIFFTEVKLEGSFQKENILGNLIADVCRNLTKSDIGMISPGNLRTFWEIGNVSEYEFYNMFPFGGNLGRYNVTGANLKKIIETVQQGKIGVYSFFGVNMTIIEKNNTRKLDYDSLKLESGEKIIDNKTYSFSSSEFMLLGGDDMKNFVIDKKMTINSTAIENILPINESFIKYFKNIAVLKENMVQKYIGNIVIKNDKNYELKQKKENSEIKLISFKEKILNETVHEIKGFLKKMF